MIAGMLWALLAILALVFIVFALMIAALASSRRVYRQEQIKLSGLRKNELHSRSARRPLGCHCKRYPIFVQQK